MVLSHQLSELLKNPFCNQSVDCDQWNRHAFETAALYSRFVLCYSEPA